MSGGDGDWERLRASVKSARTSLGLSIEKAAELAGIDRNTWGRLERGALDRHQDYVIGKIETVLGWEPGSADKILAGGEPIPIKQLADLEAELRGIANNRNRPRWLRQQANALLAQISAVLQADAEVAQQAADRRGGRRRNAS